MQLSSSAATGHTTTGWISPGSTWMTQRVASADTWLHTPPACRSEQGCEANYTLRRHSVIIMCSLPRGHVVHDFGSTGVARCRRRRTNGGDCRGSNRVRTDRRSGPRSGIAAGLHVVDLRRHGWRSNGPGLFRARRSPVRYGDRARLCGEYLLVTDTLASCVNSRVSRAETFTSAAAVPCSQAPTSRDLPAQSTLPRADSSERPRIADGSSPGLASR